MNRELTMILEALASLFGFTVVQPTGVSWESTAALLPSVAIATVATLFAHIVRKQMFPYLKLEELIAKAMENPIGAGAVFLGVCHVLASLLALFGSQLR